MVKNSHKSPDQCKRPWECLGYFGSCVGGLAAVVAAVVLLPQLYTQIKTSELEHRPYLYIDIEPRASEKEALTPGGTGTHNELYLGAMLVYKNVGKTPACDVKTEMHMYNNTDKVDDAERLEKYYIEKYGYFPRPTTVFPDQTGQEIGLIVNAGGGATQYLITIRVSYTGEDAKRTYWYSADARYFIDKHIVVKQGDIVDTRPGNLPQHLLQKDYGIWLLESNTDYDRIGHHQMKRSLPNPYK